MYVGLLANGLHRTCSVCRTAPMKAEQFKGLEGQGDWLWYRCSFNPLHVTRALPLPVQMARGV